jgi:hypothetical protein
MRFGLSAFRDSGQKNEVGFYGVTLVGAIVPLTAPVWLGLALLGY